MGMRIVAIPYYYYQHFGDKVILTQYYSNMEKYIAYMENHSENGLVVSEEEGGGCLGEWSTPDMPEIPNPFVNTYFLIKSLMRMTEIAEIIGKPTNFLKEKTETYLRAIKRAYYDAENHTFCGSVNGADAFAADLGIADKTMLEQLNSRYANRQMDTGIFGTSILIDVLFKNGYADTAFKLLTEEKKNSFWEHMNMGATTLWESWNKGGSHNHHMFGGVVSSLFYHVLGIGIEEKAFFAPKMIEEMHQTSGSIQTRFGKRALSYKKEKDNITFEIYSVTSGIFRFKNKDYPVEAGRTHTFHCVEQKS